MKYFGMVTEKQCNFLEQIVKPLRWTYTTVIPQNPSYSFQWLIQNIQLTIGGNSLVFHARPYGIFVEIKANLWRNKLLRTNQKLQFSRGRFSNRDNVDNGEKLSMLIDFPFCAENFPLSKVTASRLWSVLSTNADTSSFASVMVSFDQHS